MLGNKAPLRHQTKVIHLEINQYINVPGDTTLKVHYYRITGSR